MDKSLYILTGCPLGPGSPFLPWSPVLPITPLIPEAPLSPRNPGSPCTSKGQELKIFFTRDSLVPSRQTSTLPNYIRSIFITIIVFTFWPGGPISPGCPGSPISPLGPGRPKGPSFPTKPRWPWRHTKSDVNKISNFNIKSKRQIQSKITLK